MKMVTKGNVFWYKSKLNALYLHIIRHNVFAKCVSGIAVRTFIQRLLPIKQRINQLRTTSSACGLIFKEAQNLHKTLCYDRQQQLEIKPKICSPSGVPHIQSGYGRIHILISHMEMRDKRSQAKQPRLTQNNAALT